MVKRILDLDAIDIERMSKEEKLISIKSAEGRTLISEIVTPAPAVLHDISNTELAASFGADILLFNLYDVNEPVLEGIPNRTGQNIIKDTKKLTGKMIGVNLEPVDEKGQTLGEIQKISPGRLATKENMKKIINQGADIVVLTGNPKTGVTNKKIVESIKIAKENFGEDLIIVAGKMHAAGSREESGSKIISKETIKEFIQAGADIILLPAPGTVPGMTVDYIRDLIETVHKFDKLAMTSVGTSQEGADLSTIKNIALYSKMTGTDIHHLGDSGMSMGVALPENIMAYSIAIRGKRHTYRVMARSINR